MIRTLIRLVMRKLATRLGVLIHSVNCEIGNATLPKFGNMPRNLKIELPRRISNSELMYLGDDVWLGPGALLVAVTYYPTPIMQDPGGKREIQKFNPKIVIGNRVTSTANLQIAAMNEITIEDDVMFSSNINITDGLHGYGNANEPYKYQDIMNVAPIRIKRGCWIGQNVVVLPGVTIGEFSIIGANSVVNESIPDRCIAVGAPARVIKTWDRNSGKWVPAR